MSASVHVSWQQRRTPELYAGFVVNGMGVVLTGAVLPRIAAQWGMGDRQSGMLLAAQFLGSVLGGVLVLTPLARSLATGAVGACSGLLLASALTPSHGHLWAFYLGFFLFGYGLGQTTTSTNLIVGSQPGPRRSGGISLLQFLWSLGAMLVPLVADAALTHLSLRAMLASFSVMFLLLPTVLLLRVPELASGATAQPEVHETVQGVLPLMLYFGALFFLYGGVENSLSGWLTSYAQRFAAATAGTTPLITSAFWTGITAGRGLGTLFLRKVPMPRILRASMGAFVVFALSLLSSHRLAGTIGLAALAGLCLGPFFAAMLSWALAYNLPPRRMGLLLALTGVGAATVPMLLGAVSQAVSSLRIALLLPALCAALVLGLLLYPKGTTAAAQI